MKRLSAAVLLSVLGLPAHATPLAQATPPATAIPPANSTAARIWVSHRGNDSGFCGPAEAPCRSLQFAHDKVSNGGEVVVLDGGSYGAVQITKPISIVNEGAGVATVGAPAGGTAVTIDTTGAVVLRGLHIDGGANGSWGVYMKGGRSLEISNCSIEKMVQSAVVVEVKNDVAFTIRDTDISLSGSALVTAAAANMYGLIERVNIANTWSAVLLYGGGPGYVANVTARDVSIAHSQADGFMTFGPELFIFDSRVVVDHMAGAGNVIGVHAHGGKIHLANTTITGADAGVSIEAGGVVDSAGDNVLVGNVKDVVGGTLGVLPKQ